MDTATHFAFGFTLAGLAQIDPNVSADLWSGVAVAIGTVLGSQAPDADTLVRLRGNEAYVRHHRGMSHSLPAWIGWTALIGGALHLVFPQVPPATLLIWVFIAVALHVFTDLFNTYGTQALYPFSRRWIAWHIMPIFDPYVLCLHMAALALWTTGAAAVRVFPALYALLAVYYLCRTVWRRRVQTLLARMDRTRRPGDVYTAIPTVHWNWWHVVKRSANGDYTIGALRRGVLVWTDRYACERSPLIEQSKTHPAVASFLSFSSHPCAREERRADGTVVRWVDMRFTHRKQFPFLAFVKYNKDGEPACGFVGWISETKLEGKLGEAPSKPISPRQAGDFQ